MSNFSRRALLGVIAAGTTLAVNTAQATTVTPPSANEDAAKSKYLRLLATVFRLKGGYQSSYNLSQMNAEGTLLTQATSQGFETLFQRELNFAEGAPVSAQKIDFIPTAEAFTFDADTGAVNPINSFMTTEITISAGKTTTDGSNLILENAVLRYQDAIPCSSFGTRAYIARPMDRAVIDIRDTIKIPFAKPKLIFGLIARNDDSKDEILFALCASMGNKQG